MTAIDGWEEVIHELLGTCDSPAMKGNYVEALFDDAEFCAYLDDQIFRCNECGWWCDISEEASEDNDRDELTCSDCCGVEG